jgi:hypothetical protein
MAALIVKQVMLKCLLSYKYLESLFSRSTLPAELVVEMEMLSIYTVSVWQSLALTSYCNVASENKEMILK